MKRPHPFALYLVALLWCAGTLAGVAATQQFEAAVDRLLRDYRTTDLVGDEGNASRNAKLYDDVFAAGTREEFRNALWRRLKDPAQSEKWGAALHQALGENVSPWELTAWARNNLEALVASGDLTESIYLFGLYGIPEDADRVRKVAERFAVSNPMFAGRIELAAKHVRGHQEFTRDLLDRSAQRDRPHAAGVLRPNSGATPSERRTMVMHLVLSSDVDTQFEAFQLAPELVLEEMEKRKIPGQRDSLFLAKVLSAVATDGKAKPAGEETAARNQVIYRFSLLLRRTLWQGEPAAGVPELKGPTRSQMKVWLLALVKEARTLQGPGKPSEKQLNEIEAMAEKMPPSEEAAAGKLTPAESAKILRSNVSSVAELTALHWKTADGAMEVYAVASTSDVSVALFNPQALSKEDFFVDASQRARVKKNNQIILEKLGEAAKKVSPPKPPIEEVPFPKP